MRQTHRFSRFLVLAALCMGLSCDAGGPVDPGTLRFGQLGEMRLRVIAPLALGLGELEQVLTWRSDGRWEVHEEVRYRGLVGDVTLHRLEGSSEALANSYSQWITDVNDNPGLTLFVDDLDPDLDPVCAITFSRVTLSIDDSTSGESVSYTRCVQGFLESLSFRAEPDPSASRVANLSRLARDYTVGTAFRPAYERTQPFGTLEKGGDTPSGLVAPVVIQTQQDFDAFWSVHAPADPSPIVDFQQETVIVAARGERREAGDSLEVRVVSPVGEGTVITLVERVPGNFCAPAERSHVPYHIVVTPRVARPVSFQSPVLVELVDCG